MTVKVPLWNRHALAVQRISIDMVQVVADLKHNRILGTSNFPQGYSTVHRFPSITCLHKSTFGIVISLPHISTVGNIELNILFLQQTEETLSLFVSWIKMDNLFPCINRSVDLTLSSSRSSNLVKI